MDRGIFITFEGSEGCGKSTQIEILLRRFEERGVAPVVTREPGGTPLGEEIRQLLQHAPEGENMTPESELLLFAASRAQLVRELVQPALAAGTHVIADRFFDSTTVYQGVARQLEAEMVARINGFAVGECVPDITFLLDMDSQSAHARAMARSADTGGADRMESQPASFFEAVREGYLRLAREEGARIRVMDAAGTVDAIAEEIRMALEDRFDGIFG